MFFTEGKLNEVIHTSGYCVVVEPEIWTDSFEQNAQQLLTLMSRENYRSTRILKVVFETDEGPKIFLPELGNFCSLLYVEYCLLVFGNDCVREMVYDAEWFFAGLWGSNNKFMSALAIAYAMNIELRD